MVGASDSSGDPWYKTNRDASGLPSVYAPGVDITCPDALNGGVLKKSSGTSDGKLVRTLRVPI